MTTMEAITAAESSITTILTDAGLVEGLSLTPAQLEVSTDLLFWETHITSKKASEKKHYATFSVLSCAGSVFGDGGIIARKAIVSLNVFSRNKDVSSFLTAINNKAIESFWTFEMQNPIAYDTENQMFIYDFILGALISDGD